MKIDTKKILLAVILIACLIAIPFSISAATARWYTYHILNVWSVDSGKHLDWNGSTIYLSYFKTGVNTWNAYKSGVIREDGAFTIKDVTISDVNDFEDNSVAVTTQYHNGSGGKSTSATIQFSKTKMETLSSMQKTIVCTHELGHTLGLSENNDNGTSPVMYNNIAYNTSNNVLHSEDKFNYDYMYNNKY